MGTHKDGSVSLSELSVGECFRLSDYTYSEERRRGNRSHWVRYMTDRKLAEPLVLLGEGVVCSTFRRVRDAKGKEFDLSLAMNVFREEA
jgi:predicted dienelactone hydrolase